MLTGKEIALSTAVVYGYVAVTQGREEARLSQVIPAVIITSLITSYLQKNVLSA